jgi:hypothetical protein
MFNSPLPTRRRQQNAACIFHNGSQLFNMLLARFSANSDPTPIVFQLCQ